MAPTITLTCWPWPIVDMTLSNISSQYNVSGINTPSVNLKMKVESLNSQSPFSGGQWVKLVMLWAMSQKSDAIVFVMIHEEDD